MSQTPDVVEHAGYSFSNSSNFDVRAKELDHVLDIPVFPAQNLILDTQSVNIYDRPDKSPTFIYDGKVYHLLSPDKNQRFLFGEYGSNSRTLDYKFSGRVYAQGRPNSSYALTPTSLWLFGGNVGERDDMRDLWEYEIGTKTWIPHFLTGDVSIDEFPSDRRNSALVVDGTEVLIFGGETYIEIGNTTISLNDLWLYDGISWNILDPMALLPHSSGLIVYHDSVIVKILAGSTLYTVYKDGITDTTSVAYVGLASPSAYDTMSFVNNGIIHFSDFKSGRIYKWNDGTNTLEILKTYSYGVGYDGSTIGFYQKEQTVRTKRGGNSTYQPEISIYTPSIYGWDDDLLVDTLNIGAVPLGDYMATCDIGGGKKYQGLGLRDTVFIEDHFIWNGETNNCTRVGSDSTKPPERLLSGCCYDKTRNRVWIFGGYTGSIYYNDLWYLSLDDYTWTRVRRRSSGMANWPAARARAGMCVIEDTLWIVSGYSDTKSYSDLWKYDIPTDVAEEESLTDWVAFGTDYFLFEWRDRMWLFNGEFKLYRYFYDNKQFAPVTLYATRYEDIQTRIEDGEYITPPMSISIQENSLIITYKDVKGEWVSFFVEMDSKEIIKYPGQIYTASLWASSVRGMDTTGYLYFYNVSPFDFAQRNTFPYHEYAFSPIISGSPLTRESCLMTYWDEDVVGGIVPRPCYVDAGNMYVIYTDQVDYSPLLPTFGEMRDYNLLCNYWPQTDFSVLDGTDGMEQVESKSRVGAARFRTVPRFTWKRCPAKYADNIRRASSTWQDDASHRTYVVNDQDGHIVRYRAADGTFFNYPSKVWPESASCHRGNVLYAFGGNTQQSDTPPGVGQDGSSPSLNSQQWALINDTPGTNLSHSGLMMYDLNYIAFQLRLLADHDDLEPRNYDQIREYLVGVARNQLGVSVNGANVNEDWVETIENAVYSSTMSLVGDLSVRNVIGERGDRPFGYRCSCLSTQIGDKMYIGGGAFKWVESIKCPCNPFERCDKLHYVSSFPVLDEESGKYYLKDYNDFHVFNTSTKSWVELSPMPVSLYAATTIVSHDNKRIYVVGGFTASELSSPSSKIYVYDVEQDSWSELGPTPSGYAGRAMPSVYWLDDYRLIIMFGCTGKRGISDPNTFYRLPLSDAWMLDTSLGVMYKAFECMSKTSMIMDSMEDSNGYIHMLDFSKIWFDNLYAQASLDVSISRLLTGDNNLLIADEADTTTFDETVISAGDAVAQRSIIWTIMDPVDGSIVEARSIEVPDTLADDISPSNVIKDFVDSRGDLWFIINQRVESLDGVSYNMYLYRAAKINEYNYTLSLLAVDIPVNSGTKLVGYDGNRYLYCIWNEFNIWQLDLETAIFNPNAEYWRRLPPYPDLVDMGVLPATSSTAYSTFIKSTVYKGDILFYNPEGLVTRFDPVNFVWNIDRYPDSASSDLRVVKDGSELYYYEPGAVYGTLLGLEHKQEDKFYFDAELLERSGNLDIPTFDALIDDMVSCALAMALGKPNYSTWLSVGFTEVVAALASNLGIYPSELWSDMKTLVDARRSIVRRNRILAFSKNNHMMRAWAKKHGQLDIFLEFSSYYPATSVSLSVDYDTMNEQADLYKFTCWTSTGIQQGYGTASQIDTGYDWDPFSRVYRKLVSIGDTYTYIETERPQYLVRFPLESDSSINRLRLEFTPAAREYNYISRLNHIAVEHDSSSLTMSDDSGPLTVIGIEPFGTTESDVYMARVTNTHPTAPASSVIVYVIDNYRILLSTDLVTWKRGSIKDPLSLTTNLDPGEEKVFYLKALSYLDKSNMDLVVSGNYPPS